MEKVSLIVPFYNERSVLLRSVPKIIAFCKRHFTSSEVIFVDDGSVDGSRSLVLKLCRETGVGTMAKVVGYPDNRGRGHAIKFGLGKAHGSFVGYVDCDLELTLHAMKTAVSHLSTHDVVIASKFTRGSVVHTPIVRRMSSRLYNFITRVILGSRLLDHQAGLKFFRKQVLSNILSLTRENGWLWDTEIMYLAQKKGYRIFEMPITITYGFRNLRVSFITDFLKLPFVLTGLKHTLDMRINRTYNT